MHGHVSYKPHRLYLLCMLMHVRPPCLTGKVDNRNLFSSIDHNNNYYGIATIA